MYLANVIVTHTHLHFLGTLWFNWDGTERNMYNKRNDSSFAIKI